MTSLTIRAKGLGPCETAQISAMVIAGNRQILSHAVAALGHFQVPTERTILVVSSATAAFQDAVLASAAAYPWAEIFRVLPPPAPPGSWRQAAARVVRQLRLSVFSQLAATRRCARRFRRLARANSQGLAFIVSGFYGHPVDRTACCLVPHDQFVLVDDGYMTREVARRRADERTAGFKNTLTHNSTYAHAGRAGRIKLYLMKKIGGVRDDGSPRVAFFTHHHDLALSGGDRLIPYAPDQRAAAVSALPNTVHFLGMPAIQRQIVAPEKFALLLEAVATRYRGAELHYFGHPAEGEDEFQLVRQHLPSAQIHANLEPYEQTHLHLDRVPSIVAGFYSSTHFNLAAHRGLTSRLELLEIPDPWILSPSRRERIRSIYRDAENHPNIQRIPYARIGERPDDLGSAPAPGSGSLGSGSERPSGA